jgi:translation elongation factor EF-G
MNLKAWFTDLIERPSARLPGRVRVEGIRNKHLGPRWEYARIVVEAESSDSFSVSGPERPLDAESETFVRAAAFGVLDVVLTAAPIPLRDFCLRIVEVHVHPVDSSVMAFRRAGRDAGEQLLREAGLQRS